MPRAFDISRRSSYTPPTPRKTESAPTARKSKRKVGSFWLYGIFGIAILIFIIGSRSSADTQTPSNAETITPTPSSTVSLGPSISATPTPSNLLTYPSTTPSITPLETPAPTPSSTPTISKDDIKIRILNGSGKSGAATTMKTNLTSLGYTVGTTGTAKNRYSNTIIYYRTRGKDKAELIQTDLLSKNVNATITEDDNLTKPDDILIVVGTK